MSFLGTLFKGVAGFVTGGPVGAVGAVLPGLLKGRALQIAPSFAPDSTITSTRITPFSYSKTVKEYPGNVDGSGYRPAQGTALTAPGMACAMVWDGHRYRTTHPNKATYVTRGGGTSRWPQQLIVHPKGTECVTHRRMNPGNGRAAVHAVRRLAAFHHLAKRVEAQLHRIAKPRVSRSRAHASGCGCGSCKR